MVFSAAADVLHKGIEIDEKLLLMGGALLRQLKIFERGHGGKDPR